MRLMQRALRGVLAGGILLVAVPAMAATITFDWTTANPNVVGGDGAAFGNSRTLTVGGVTVTATAWGYTQGTSFPGTAFESAGLGAYSSGLGVCNQDEDPTAPPNCGSPNHAIGNRINATTNNTNDFVLFQFSTAIDPKTVTIDTFGVSYDRDVTYWLGNVVGTLNLAGKTYANLATLGFGSQVNNSDVASPDGLGAAYARDVSIPPTGGPFYNALLFGAQINGQADGNDYFKLSTLTIDTAPAVPEPVALVLVGLGMAGLQQYRRRMAANV